MREIDRQRKMQKAKDVINEIEYKISFLSHTVKRNDFAKLMKAYQVTKGWNNIQSQVRINELQGMYLRSVLA